jgi:hypothetical protein
MDRERFEYLLAAYGADFRRWPEAERAAGEAFAAQHGADVSSPIAEAQALDGALSQAPDMAPSPALLARVRAAAPRQRSRPSFDYRAALALAACAVFGLVLGYGGGMLAPVADQDDDAYFVAAFDASFVETFGGEDE